MSSWEMEFHEIEHKIISKGVCQIVKIQVIKKSFTYG